MGWVGIQGKEWRSEEFRGGELILVGSRAGFDLLPHRHGDAIAQEKRLISGVGINVKMKIKIKLPSRNRMKICLRSPNLPGGSPGDLGSPIPPRVSLMVRGSRAQPHVMASTCKEIESELSGAGYCGDERRLSTSGGTPSYGCFCLGIAHLTKQMVCSGALGSNRPVEQFNLQK